VEGRDFLHPDLRLKFTVPNGYGMQNGADAVSISGNGGQAQFSTAAYNGDMNAYIAAAFKAVAGKASINPGTIQRTTVNGIPAYYSVARANTQSGPVDVTVFAYEFSRTNAYHFVALTKAGGAAVFDPMFSSVRRLNASEVAAIRPRRIDVVTVARGDTVATLARRMAYRDYQTERFQVLNRLGASSRLAPGQKVKIVVYASR
jgi:predicted Zn-dependent protease